MNIFDTTALDAAAIEASSPAAGAAETRAGIFRMTQAAEEAVMRPRDAGGWSHELRAALAARIAMLNGEHELARRFAARAGEAAMLADPADDGAAHGLETVIAFMDRVAAQTRDVTEADISALQDAGVPDADIVRLAELNAFLGYQLRVIAGLRLMRGTGE